MRRSTGLGLTIACLVACCALSFGAAGPTEEKENHPDGTLHFKVPLDVKGQRNGIYQAYYPGGKKLQERARYDHGERTGVRELFNDKGQQVGEESWLHGKLVCPKSQRMIEAMRKQVFNDSAQSVLKMGKFTNTRAPQPENMAKALAKLNTYRYLCDVPPDVVLENDYINLCQHAAELLVKVGHLTHTPDKPAGYDEAAYQMGKDGCGRSNIFQGGDAIGSVDAYMNDSDPGNIDRLGHRRWCLNPKMSRVGFGTSGSFSAMYSFDSGRQDVPEYDFVCYPPRGYCPQTLFSPNYAWHASFNPSKYTIGKDAALKIYLVDARLQRTQPLELNYEHVDTGGFGINNAIIARPKNFAIKVGTVYEVVVTGVTAKEPSADAKEATADAKDPKDVKDAKPSNGEITYYVTFY